MSSLPLLIGACTEDTRVPLGPHEPDTVAMVIEMRPPERVIGMLGGRLEVGALVLNEPGDTLYGSYLSPGRFSWTSSDPDVATLSRTPHPLVVDRELRVVTGLRVGTAQITATSGGLSNAMTVTVRDAARHAWSVPIGAGSTDGGITIGTDGTIYVGANGYGSSRAQWSAWSPQGTLLWTTDLPRTWNSTPAIGADGTLYLGSSGEGAHGTLTALNASGVPRWVLDELDPIRASPALGPDGTIYVVGTRHVYAVDPDGTIVWAHEAAGNAFAFSAPAVAPDGTILVGGTDQRLYAIHPDGTTRWTFLASGLVHSSPAVGTDGTIYFGAIGAGDGRLHAVNPDGTERWSVRLGSRLISSSPSIGPDGTIYVIAHGVNAIDPTGVIRWSYGCGTNSTSAVLGADGTIYFAGCAPGAQGTGRDALSALDPQGRLRWEYRTGGRTRGAPAIASDGTILIASYSDDYEATLHAITETSSANGGFDGAPWPTARGNRANNGRAGS